MAREDEIDVMYQTLLSLAEEMTMILSVAGPMHPREIIPEGREGNKTLYGCMSACSEPDWGRFDAFEYNACMEDQVSNSVEPLFGKDEYKAEFWSVYGHLRKEYGYGLEAITDVSTRKQAVLLCNRHEEKRLAASKAHVATPLPGSLRELLSG